MLSVVRIIAAKVAVLRQLASAMVIACKAGVPCRNCRHWAGPALNYVTRLPASAADRFSEYADEVMASGQDQKEQVRREPGAGCRHEYSWACYCNDGILTGGPMAPRAQSGAMSMTEWPGVCQGRWRINEPIQSSNSARTSAVRNRKGPASTVAVTTRGMAAASGS